MSDSSQSDQLPDNLPERLPVAIITGFLGSGKTTLLRHLLAHPEMDETAVIINEFGEIGLDHALVERADEDIVVLNSGCLCCTVRGDLVNTLRGLYARRSRGDVPAFRRVVVETTGLADPAPIIHTLMSDPLVSECFRLDGIVTTVDAVNGARTLDNHPEAVKQAAVADRLLITKTDMPEAAATAALEGRLRALNPAAPLRRAVHGAVPPAALFGAGLFDPAKKAPDVRGWLNEEAYAAAAAHGHGHGHDHDHQHHDVNRHDDHIRAFCIALDDPLEWDKVAVWLDFLAAYRGDDLLRIKGILNVKGADAPVAIHGVQHIFHAPALLAAWPDADRRSRIVFITRDLSRDTIEQSLTALGVGAPESGGGATRAAE